MIIVVGEARFATGELDRLEAQLMMLEAATRSEPGCLHYSLSRDISDRDLLIVSHRWASEEALAAHFQTRHLLDLAEMVDETRIETLSVKSYRADYLRTLLSRPTTRTETEK